MLATLLLILTYLAVFLPGLAYLCVKLSALAD
jgi:hypothetical protein